jgi:hypothetical protein
MWDVAEFDFWNDRLGIQCGGYNGAVDVQIYHVAKMIVEARLKGTTCYVTDIAKALEMSETHVEMIQYILASVIYPKDDPKALYNDRHPFDYGTSPRGLFVGSLEKAQRFLQEFEEYYETHWEEKISND